MTLDALMPISLDMVPSCTMEPLEIIALGCEGQ